MCGLQKGVGGNLEIVFVLITKIRRLFTTATQLSVLRYMVYGLACRCVLRYEVAIPRKRFGRCWWSLVDRFVGLRSCSCENF
jgi:hypothetical protein